MLGIQEQIYSDLLRQLEAAKQIRINKKKLSDQIALFIAQLDKHNHSAFDDPAEQEAFLMFKISMMRWVIQSIHQPSNQPSYWQQCYTEADLEQEVFYLAKLPATALSVAGYIGIFLGGMAIAETLGTAFTPLVLAAAPQLVLPLVLTYIVLTTALSLGFGMVAGQCVYQTCKTIHDSGEKWAKDIVKERNAKHEVAVAADHIQRTVQSAPSLCRHGFFKLDVAEDEEHAQVGEPLKYQQAS